MSTVLESLPEITFFAGPPVNSTGRLMIAKVDDVELYRDKVQTDSDRDRQRFLRRLEVIVGCQPNALEHLAAAVVTAADLADALVEQGDENREPHGRRRAQSSLLVELAEQAELFHTAQGECYATVDQNGKHATFAIRRKDFKEWLARQYYMEHDTVPNSQAMNDALNTIGGQAKYDGAEHPVYIRFAPFGTDVIYVDLGGPQWRAACITRDGWDVVDNPPIKFRRVNGMLALPEPVLGGQLTDLRQFINVNDDQWPLVAAWLIAAARPQGPYPVAVIGGEQGTAKSTATRVLRRMIDPNQAELRSEPRDAHDLIIMATNSWTVAMDNLSYVHPWLSDGLCRLSTGGGFSARELYTDGDEILFAAQRPSIINGINELATRGDLIDRSLLITLEEILSNRRRTESDVWHCFDAAHPRLLGALYSAVSIALRNLPDVTLPNHPRMADFAEWSVAAEPAMGVQAGDFLDSYLANLHSANELTLESSQPAHILVRWLRNQQGRQWSGTASELLDTLARSFGTAHPPRNWPANGQALSGHLRRLAPSLRGIGVDIEFVHSGERTINITTTESFNPQPAQRRPHNLGSRNGIGPNTDGPDRNPTSSTTLPGSVNPSSDPQDNGRVG